MSNSYSCYHTPKRSASRLPNKIGNAIMVVQNTSILVGFSSTDKISYYQIRDLRFEPTYTQTNRYLRLIIKNNNNEA